MHNISAMSQRIKRPNRTEDGFVPVKRRKRMAVEDEEAATLARIYNRNSNEAPAELFRKDLISAMKLPDSEPLSTDEYWIIQDQWKQEWERGVQVPVNPDSLPAPSVSGIRNARKSAHEFKLPKNKYIRITKDENFNVDEHVLSNAPSQAEDACSYDLDENDVAWLKLVNAERATCGLGPVHEDQLERVIERFEMGCWEKIQTILRNEEGLGIEFDENVICDVCRSPDSEEGNEMVFCDSCNICVHQACYGITRIPEGQWLCCTCNLAIRPKCVLCPNKGGAMKCTRSGQKWAHVSCALWIPEVSIGCVEKMEPITKISSIPPSRWALICVLCRERVGACIQCSVKTCKTAYHVTCAFKHGLEMRAIIEDENADDGVKLRSYCEKHSKSSKKEKSICSGSEDDDNRRRKRKDMTSEEKNLARAARLQEIESEFYKFVSVKDVSINLNVDQEALNHIYNYWKLKRKSGHNRPLLPPKSEDIGVLVQSPEDIDTEKLKTFVQLRQDLERVRNLCYMVTRREKLSRSLFRLREQTFFKQTAVLESGINLPNAVISAVIEANHGPSIYDRLYSYDQAEDHSNDFELLLTRILGLKSPTGSGDEKKPDINGVFKDVKSNPYKKVYFNGSKRRSSALYSSMSSSSSSSSDEKQKENKENRFNSTSDDAKPISSATEKKTKAKKQMTRKMTDRRKKPISSNEVKSESSTSSDEDIKPPAKKQWGNSTFNRSKLSMVEHQLGLSGTDSDDLMELKNNRKMQNRKTKISSIYSDSDSSDSTKNDDKSGNNSDSQQKLRTKASVKEFSNKPSTSKGAAKSNTENKKKTKVEESKKDSSVKKKDYVPSDLIVPQRQAAKKASENLKNNTTGRPKDSQPLQNDEALKVEEKPRIVKQRVKSRDTKELPKEKIDKHERTEKVEKPEKIDNGEKLDKCEKDKAVNMETSENEKEDKMDTELLAYVPQRQAAKKAAEHIKSGLGKPNIPSDSLPLNDSDKTKRENENSNKIKKDFDAKPKKEPEIEKMAKITESKRKSSSVSSSSSSSSYSSGSSSSSSSSSDDDDESEEQKSRSESLISVSHRDQVKRANAKDRPFLDKGSKSATSSSSTSDSGNSTPSSVTQKPNTAQSQPPKQSPSEVAERSKAADSSRSPRKSFDKKISSPAPEREELKPKNKQPRGRPRSSNSSEVGNTGSRNRDLSNSKCFSVEKDGFKNRKRKRSTSEDMETIDSTEKTTESSVLLSPVREKEKKLNESSERKIPSDIDKTTSNLEKEISERKASKDNKTKSTLDRLLGPIGNTEKFKHEVIKNEKEDKRFSEKRAKIEKLDKPIDKNDKIFKENKEHPIAKDKSSKKSPCKNAVKSTDDLYTKSFIEVKLPSQSELSTISEKSSNLDQNSITTNIEESSKNKPEEEHIPLEINQVDENVKSNTEITPDSGNMNRSIFSPQPQPKDNDLLDFDNFDDSLEIHKEDDILRPFTFNTSVVNNDDTREENVRETLNLVEKLRLGLSKKPTGCEIDDTLSIGSNSKHDDRSEFLEQVVPDNVNEELPAISQSVQLEETPKPMVNLEMKVELSQNKIFDGHNQDYQFLNCRAEIPEACSKSIPIEQQQRLSDTLTTQGDERWVPPSDQNYSNITGTSHLNYMTNNSQAEPQNFLDHYSASVLDHHKKYPEVNNILNDVSARLQEEVLETQPHLLHGQRISAPVLETISDMNPNNPKFPDLHIHPPSWSDSAMLPHRRSSSSSAASSISSTSRRNEIEEDSNKLRGDMMVVNPPPNIDISLFPSQLIPTFQPNPLEPFTAYSEASPFVNPVSLFAGPNLNTQLAYPSAGPTGFPPAFGAPFPTPHVLPPIPKPEENIQYPSACTAAFTSSQHNMALTAAMVNLPTKEMEPSLEDHVQISQKSLNPIQHMEHKETIPTPQESPIVSSAATSVTEAIPSSPSQKSTSGKKSPSKPTRSSARVTSQMMNKSPIKSPGKSPRQDSSKHGNTAKKDSKKTGKGSAGKGNQYQGKGRGRGRGRARPPVPTPHMDYDIMGNTNTIQKLVGTVYDLDFDDEWNETTDLKSMRERRKSVDAHEKKTDNSYLKENVDSPKFSSPLQNTQKNKSYADLSNLRPPTPFNDSNKESEPTSLKIEEEPSKSVFPDLVPPFLPGPVDMRTYNSSYEEQKYESTHLLQAFEAGTTENQVNEGIDEEYEKELHAALMCKEKSEQTPVPEISNIKVSLSDSRNQLKVKIKGPIANYTSTVTPLPPPMVEPIVVTNITSSSVTINVANNSNTSGTSNLRRMRKKELLRQYWSQDMSTDDPTSIPVNNTPADPIVHRTVTIPKAVTSVTSIPTKEDYRDYRTGNDDFLETKQHKKETKARSALSRELRQLDLSLDDETLSDRRRGSATGSTNASFNESTKRRGRPPRTSTEQPLVTPKLKIKIGNNSIISSTRIDDKKDKIRPPKKRISNIPMPSVEDLKRESMKYRKMVMAGFGEQKEKEKKKKKDKSEKKKKKKKHAVEIISNDTEKQKLIIRFSKKVDGETNKRTSVNSESAKTDHSVIHDPLASVSIVGESSCKTNSRCSPPKVTPIKLKLSRCQEGSGYIMKPAVEDNSHITTEETPVSQPGQPPPPHPTPPLSAELSDAVQPPPDPLPLNKDCEVR